MSLLTDVISTNGISFEEILSCSPQNGMIMEFGVAQGDSIRKIAKHFPDRTIYGFDWFEGLPEDWRDNYRKGHFKCEPPTDLPSNVKLVVGLFQDTLQNFLKEHSDPIAFIHMDADLYSSTKCVLNAVINQLQDGTIILFDEFYGYSGFEYNEYKAFQEFIDLGLYTYNCIGKLGDEKAAFRIHSLAK